MLEVLILEKKNLFSMAIEYVENIVMTLNTKGRILGGLDFINESMYTTAKSLKELGYRILLKHKVHKKWQDGGAMNGVYCTQYSLYLYAYFPTLEDAITFKLSHDNN